MNQLDVAILINNVGCSYEHYEYLHNVSDETIANLIAVNIQATTQVRNIYMCNILVVNNQIKKLTSKISFEQLL